MTTAIIYKAAHEIGRKTRLGFGDKHLSAEAMRVCDAVRARQNATECEAYARGYWDGHALRDLPATI